MVSSPLALMPIRRVARWLMSQQGELQPMRLAFLSAALATSLMAPALVAPALAQTGNAPAYPAYPPPPTQAAPGMPTQGIPPMPQGVPPGANPVTGARPGNDIGTGMSLPLGNHASNINGQDTQSDIAPNLPSPQLGPNASPADYLRAAQNALAAGQTGQAQQALEEAETRLLDRSVPYGQTGNPSDNPAITAITQALNALAAGNRMQCMQLIQAAIPPAEAVR